MHRVVLGTWLGFACVACAQQPVGDVFQTGTVPVRQAYENLYRAAAEITTDPSADYMKAGVSQIDFPKQTQAQNQWFNAMASRGQSLTARDRQNLVPCAAHMNNAIADMERGYRIHIEPGSPLKERTVVSLYAAGRAEFRMCSSSGELKSGATSSGTNGNTPGVTPGQQGTPGNTPDANQGNNQFPAPWDPNTQIQGFSCPFDMNNYNPTDAAPALRYQTGFSQGVSQCLANQCTQQNLAMAVWTSAFPVVRAILGSVAVGTSINAILHPPGFSSTPDPYQRGKEEGARVCGFLLQAGAAAGVAQSVRIPVSKTAVPRNFDFYKAVDSISNWIKEMNPTKCTNNCGLATINSVRTVFGQPLEPAPGMKRGMDDATMQRELGTGFTARDLTKQQMIDFMNKQPEGSVAVIGGWPQSLDPGHFFWAVRAYGKTQYWDGQLQRTAALPSGQSGIWRFNINIVGNPLRASGGGNQR